MEGFFEKHQQLFLEISLSQKMESACYGLGKCRRPAMGLLNTSGNVTPLTD